MQRCPMCKVDNCYTELSKHQSETSLRTLARAWAQFYKMMTGSAEDKNELVVLVMSLCEEDHSKHFSEWCDTMSGHMKHLAEHGITVRRRATWRPK